MFSLNIPIIHQCNIDCFMTHEDEENKEHQCQSLIMCIIYTLNEGLRNGGGIGDVLRKPSSTVSTPALSLCWEDFMPACACWASQLS